jgi:hypothetical protein
VSFTLCAAIGVPAHAQENAIIAQPPKNESTGIIIDLNSLVDPSVPLLTSAAGIKNRGQIVAGGIDGQVYILTRH